MREKISVFIITKNEENKIERCLKHVSWADEIIIVDSESTDKTKEIAKKITKKIYNNTFKGYGPQKQIAINKCTNKWILEVDADEIITEKLKNEILNLLKTPVILNKCVAYTIIRQEYFLKKKLMTSKIPRLYKKDAVQYNKLIHEELKIKGKIGKLKQKIIHEADSYNTIAKQIDKINEYTKKEAEIKYTEKKWNIPKIVCYIIIIPPTYFTWLYIGKGLILKGYRGLIWSLLTYYYHFLIYAKIYEYIYKEKQGTTKQCQ
ncbi:MAG: glycosyltransferase family 2 protein [Candidatus Woesearchaeota archaeon]|jgi:glycosyltransferase involved in cell wall biosynthesis